MSIRQLPKLDLGIVRGDGSALCATALAKWDQTLQPRAAADDENTISIMGPIGEDFWTGEGITAKRVMGILRTIGPKPVTAYINSPGGNMFEGLGIYNAFREHPAEVTIRVLSIAASAASLIAMAGDQIEIAKAGFLMIHNAQIFDDGNRHDKREIADKLEQFDSAMAGLYVDRTGMKKATIAQMMDDETFLSGEDAIAKKFADALLPADAAQRDAKEKGTERARALSRADAAMAKAGLTRAERRDILQELTSKPRAADDEPATPRAGNPAVIDGDVGLSLALARLKLLRA